MLATFLLSCCLAPAAPADGGLTPKLERGTELVYRGSFSEQSAADRVRFQRVYRFETRLLVIECRLGGCELAAMTHLQDKTPRPAGAKPEPGAVRLERLKLESTGRVAPGFPAPLEGPPSLEVGMFVELPPGRLDRNRTWDEREAGRPDRAWQLAGTESVLAQSCTKLVGVQASDDWEKPRADRGAWRRIDTVWVEPRSGLTVRVERTVELREPASREISRLGTLRYDLESSLRHLHTLIDDRRSEIARAIDFRLQAEPLLPQPLRRSRDLAALARKINGYLESQPATPYREAVLAVKRNVDAAVKGEVVTVAAYQEAPKEAPTGKVGAAAPEFLATDMTGPGSARLARFKGRPILMVFYHPASESAPDLLRWAQAVNASLGKYAHVVGMSAGDDAAAVLKQRSAAGATFPVLHGSGLRASYGVTGTPTLIVIDADGMIRGSYLGWGRETGAEVLEELRRWLTPR